MSDDSVKLVQGLEKARAEIAKSCYPAFDEQLLYTLERRHLDVPAITDALTPESGISGDELMHFFSDHVRLLRVDEIAYDADEEVHLPSIECVLSAMRGQGVSMVFLVHGSRTQVSVYMGLADFGEQKQALVAVDAFRTAVEAHFPGSVLNNTDVKDVESISRVVSQCPHIGVMSGIPSLKRDEERNIFVQGVERLIRSMRGKEYIWMSIADPISDAITMRAIESCRGLQSDIHHLVKTQLSKATSAGKTVQMGLFGMKGQGSTDGESRTTGGSTADTTGTSHQQNKLDPHQRVTKGLASVLTVAGPLIGSAIGSVIPGAGTLIGGMLGSAIGNAVKDIGEAIAGTNGHSDTTSSSHTETKTWSNTTSHSVSHQLAGGGFGSFGLSWTKTTTVGSELLNRKMQYAEEVLQAYEQRLQEGLALGMWNLGHYLCTKDESTYRQGCGVIHSLFSGMDSTYEPPRAIRLPEHCAASLRRFSNIYMLFSKEDWVSDKLKEGASAMVNHPLGVMFNGPATPVNTRELAIVTPFATQDVEGITISKRAAFGVNVPLTSSKDAPALSLGSILDRGNKLDRKVKLNVGLLKKHMAVFGLTGSGKTNTVHHLLIQLWKKHHIPFMVIEPAKAEYRALAENEDLKDDLLIISAGAERSSVCPLRLNPFSFSPGKDSDANRIHVLTHIDKLKATFNASFPMYASMPYILEEAILQVYRERGWDLGRSVNRYIDIYADGADFSDYLPSLYDLYLKVDSIVSSKGYYQEQQMNIQAALKARLASLMVGSKGSMLNCVKSIPDEDLWNRPVIIELENMGDDDEKAFLMGLLVSKLYEYRKSTFNSDSVTEDKPCHVLVIEEAHRLLPNIPETAATMESANAKGKAVSAFVDMLSEIRALGQSVVVVDQLPSRVSPNIVKGTATKIVHRLLAKDDRAAVGGTMGLKDSQIDDLCLLRTGECVVNQEGIAASYLCRVPLCHLHQNRTGGETSSYTESYVAKHIELLAGDDEPVSREDVRVHDAFRKIMLAIGCGQSAEDLQIVAHRVCPSGCERQTFRYYWKMISLALWDAYQGNYHCFHSMVKAGYALFDRTIDAAEYRQRFAAYFLETPAYRFSPDGSLEGVAFRTLCDDKKLMAFIDQQFDRVMNTEDKSDRLAQAIRRALPLLDIPGVRMNPAIRNAIIRSRLSALVADGTLESIIKQLN